MINRKEIYIRLRDGEKESELKMNHIEDEHKLSVIDGLFKFFDVEVDFKDLADIYHRSGKAYQDFYDNIDSETDYNDEKPKVDTEQWAATLKEELESSQAKKSKETLIENSNKDHQSTEPIKAAPHLNSNDHFLTGIKYDSLGKPLYRCRYKCPDKQCEHESNHYVKIGTQHVRCWQCQRMLKVKPATSFGEPDKEKNPDMYRDDNGNFYIAGSFEMSAKTLADKEAEQHELDH